MRTISASASIEKAGFEVVPINGYIGAEIRGIDLRRSLAPEQFRVIHNALVEHEVIVMRDQDITLEQQLAFGRLFGKLSIHPFSPNMKDKPEVIVLDYSADNPPALTDVWHSDETFRDIPPLGTILRARIVPTSGGDTLFASMTAAYRGLSERMKKYIHGLEAQHDFKPFRTLFGSSPKERATLRRLEDSFPNPWHPVVRVHPVTRKRILNVNPQFTIRIRDMKEDESSHLLQFLYPQALVPEFQLRVKWQSNTVVMWDNRSVQHYALHDYYPRRRLMERVTIVGDRPIGVSGPYAAESAPDKGGRKQVETGSKPGRSVRRAFERR